MPQNLFSLLYLLFHFFCFIWSRFLTFCSTLFWGQRLSLFPTLSLKLLSLSICLPSWLYLASITLSLYDPISVFLSRVRLCGNFKSGFSPSFEWQRGTDIVKLFFKWPIHGLFLFIFSIFQKTNKYFTTKSCDKMSFQYLVLGFELTSSWPLGSSNNL